MKREWFYLHTIDGKPAYFAGDQIVYAGGRWPRRAQPLVASLTQLREEQRASAAWRVKRGYDPHRSDYGYVRVSLPEPVSALRRRRATEGK